MIHVAKLSELSFSIQFDDGMKETLSEIAQWGPVEKSLQGLLSDFLLGPSSSEECDSEPDNDYPF